MTTKVKGQFSEDMVNLESKIIQEFDEIEVSLEKVVSIVSKRLGLDKKFKPIVMYEEPFEFFISTNADGVELKLTAHDLLVACNSLEDDDAYFLDIPDMMNELKDALGGEPLELIVGELKKNPQILACMRKI